MLRQVMRALARLLRVATGARLPLAAFAALTAGTPAGGATLALLAEVGPWPWASQPIVYRGRVWFATGVKFTDHNSADIYSFDPRARTVRFERRLFSQDVGQPAVADGLLYWPYEDPRFSNGWGHFAVTNGTDWRTFAIPTALAFHVHAMAQAGGNLFAATSAWRAGLQLSADGGRTWRMLYDRPTPPGRLSRIYRLAARDGVLYGNAIDRLADGTRRGLWRLERGTVRALDGWPAERVMVGFAGVDGGLFAIARSAGQSALYALSAEPPRRVATPPGLNLVAIAADDTGLWLLHDGEDGGRVFRRADGDGWTAIAEYEGGDGYDMTVLGGRVYVTGRTAAGKAALWGPATEARDGEAPPPAPALPAPATRPIPAGDWSAAAARLERALGDPARYQDHGRGLRDVIYPLALADPPPDFFARHLGAATPDIDLDLIGGRVKASAAELARWQLLWAMAIADAGEVPVDLIAEPWRTPRNDSEKYFATGPIAIWVAGEIGRADAATIAAMIDRLDAADDPPWLTADLIGALTALTGRDFGHDPDAWRAWWRRQPDR